MPSKLQEDLELDYLESMIEMVDTISSLLRDARYAIGSGHLEKAKEHLNAAQVATSCYVSIHSPKDALRTLKRG